VGHIVLAGVLLSLSAPAAGGGSSFYWYGQRIPVVRAPHHVTVETTPAGGRSVEAVATRAGARVSERLSPARRTLVTLDVAGLDAAQRKALEQRLAATPGFVAFLLPLRSRGVPAGEVREVADRFVLARFPDGTSRAAVERLGASAGFKVAKQYAYAPASFLLETRDARDALGLARHLVESKVVQHAEPDRWVRPRLYAVSDAYFARQWHLQSANDADIGAAEAWDRTTGEPGVVVAVADTGVEMGHPEFSAPGKLVHPLDVFDGDTDPTPPPGDPNDPTSGMLNAHGTACAGLVAAPADGDGVVGVCPDCSIMPIRLGPGNGMWSSASLIEVFDHVRLHGARVMSNSWGLGMMFVPQAVMESMEAAMASGVAVFFASGNGQGHMAPRDFGAHPDAISIGGVSPASKHVSYSDVGPAIDLAAPTMEVDGMLGCPKDGPGILTTDITGDDGMNTGMDSMMNMLCPLFGGAEACEVSNGFTCYFSGTSAACPIAAGAGGLVVSMKQDLTPATLRWTLVNTAQKVGTTPYDARGWNEEMGHGRVDLVAAWSLVADGGVCVPVPETGAACSDNVDNDCDGQVDGADTDCGFVFPPPVDLGAFGTACQPTAYGEDEAHCGTDLACATLGQPSMMGGGTGFCTLLCETECPEGFLCARTPDPATGVESGACVKECDVQTPCPGTFVCVTSDKVGNPAAGVCLPSCTGDNQCPTNLTCNTQLQACAATSRVGGAPDAGVTRPDASTPAGDAGAAGTDAALPGEDAGQGGSSSGGSSSGGSAGDGNDDDKKGCGCRADAAGGVGGWSLLALLGLVTASRRRRGP
jgi:subtilisin family serine protease